MPSAPSRSGALVGDRLTFGYQGAPSPAVDNVSVRVDRGKMLAVLGPNGSGKSTLLKLLAGELDPSGGEVRLDGGPLASLSDRERALSLGIVAQSEASPFPITVRELVSMGRYPHVGPWASLEARDIQAVDQAMEQCGVQTLANRQLDTLSGGERQRARVARALAQRPKHLLLDEPTTGLDLHYQMELLVLLGDLCTAGMGVLIVTHDLNLAARFADEMILLAKGKGVSCGSPEEVLRAERLAEVYEWPFRIVAHPGPGPDKGAPQAVPLAPNVAGARPHDA